MKLPVNEIFISVDGEVNEWGQGKPTVFIRTQGCNLDCSYCDTPDSKDHSTPSYMTVEHIRNIVFTTGIKKVTITGGEPLLHRKEMIWLIQSFTCVDYKVSIETNGTQVIPNILSYDKNVCFIVDFKQGKKIEDFLQIFKERGGDFPEAVPYYGPLWIKFIIGNEQEFHNCSKALEKMKNLDNGSVNFAFAGIYEKTSPEQILEWALYWKKDYPNITEVSINVQLHKLIFPEGEKSYILKKK